MTPAMAEYGRGRDGEFDACDVGSIVGTDGNDDDPRHLFGYAVKTLSFAFTIVWHANPHLASFPWRVVS